MNTNEFSEKTIAIVGFGQVGSCVATILNAVSRNCSFQILNHSKDISGGMLDLNHAGVMRNNRFEMVNRHQISRADYIIYTAGKCNTPTQTRKSVLEDNVRIVSDVFSGVFLKKETKILVISNPVEMICAALDHVLKGENEIIGTGTLLDTYRLKYILAKRYDVDYNEIETQVLGEHGEGMLPLFSQTYFSDIKVDFSDVEKEDITKELRNSARSIRQTEEATKYGVSQCVVELMEALESSEIANMSICVKADEKLKNRFGLKTNTFINLECQLSSTNLTQLIPECDEHEEKELSSIFMHLEDVQQTIPTLL